MAEGRPMWMAPKILISNNENYNSLDNTVKRET